MVFLVQSKINMYLLQNPSFTVDHFKAHYENKPIQIY